MEHLVAGTASINASMAYAGRLVVIMNWAQIKNWINAVFAVATIKRVSMYMDSSPQNSLINSVAPIIPFQFMFMPLQYQLDLSIWT